MYSHINKDNPIRQSNMHSMYLIEKKSRFSGFVFISIIIIIIVVS